MNIGDYVRTKSYGIKKIKGFSSTLEEDFIECDYDKYQKVLINKKEIIETKPNIIDLIEEGDYVNGEQITSIEDDDNINNEKLLYYYIPSDWGEDCFREKDIKSIVTKEQFESMEYKIK